MDPTDPDPDPQHWAHINLFSRKVDSGNFQKEAMFTVQTDTNSMFYVPRTYNSTEHF
jgi:hypothetical protein